MCQYQSHFQDALDPVGAPHPQTEMMETLSTSIIPKEEREAEFAHVLSAVVDPLVALCEGAHSQDPAAKSLFTINSLYTIQVGGCGLLRRLIEH